MRTSKRVCKSHECMHLKNNTFWMATVLPSAISVISVCIAERICIDSSAPKWTATAPHAPHPPFSIQHIESAAHSQPQSQSHSHSHSNLSSSIPRGQSLTSRSPPLTLLHVLPSTFSHLLLFWHILPSLLFLIFFLLTFILYLADILTIPRMSMPKTFHSLSKVARMLPSSYSWIS